MFVIVKTTVIAALREGPGEEAIKEEAQMKVIEEGDSKERVRMKRTSRKGEV